ncbi:MAG: 16S rRNA (adenine(1518)-N(6)/adenine(1519)-N(6))-dimethyltransferase RsmA [Patescibacteria group bacterium]
MTKLGQHFLTDKRALKKIAELLDLKKSDLVLEIGPGHGELTEQIASYGCEINAIEKDGQLAEFLNKKFSGNEKIKIMNGDALKVLPSLIENCKLKIENYKLIGNIPYYITGKLLRTIGELPYKPRLSVLTIQKEVAERLASKPPRMNRLAASVQFWAKPEIAFILPKDFFRPRPEVDSATIVLRPAVNGGADEKAYYKMVRVIFRQPRKTVLNNLAAALEIPKDEIETGLKKAGIEPNSRPQNLSLEDIFKLASNF